MKKKGKNCKTICLLLATSFIINVNPPIEAFAGTNQRIYSYTSKSMITVSDTQVAYLYNGIPINLSGTPGILTSNNVAIAPYVPIFRDQLGIKTYYNKSKKTVTFQKDSTTLVLTLGSKTAKVNGKAVEMSAAPMSMKYSSSGKTSILVPTRFVAETFGIYYEWNSNTETVIMNKPLQLSYNNQNINYSGVSGFVTFDGEDVDVRNLPTIIMENTAMVQAFRVFYNQLGVDYKFDKESKKIILNKGDITLELVLDSSIAYINGKKVDCKMPPKLVRNQETNTEAVLVPGQFVAKALGYDYSWNSSTKTSEITTTDLVGVKPNMEIPNGSNGSNGSSGNSGSAAGDYQPIQYFNWKEADDLTTIINAAKEAAELEKVLGTATNSTTYLNSVLNIPKEDETEAVQFSFSSPFSKATCTQNGSEITLLLENTYSNPNQYNFNSKFVKSAQVEYDSNTLITKVILTTNQEKPNFKMVSSEDKTTLNITIYPNFLTNIVAGSDKNGTPYLTYTSLATVQPVITEDVENIYVQLPDTRNAIGDQTYSGLESPENLLDFVILQSPSTNSTLLIIHKPSKDATYQLKNEGGSTTIYFNQVEKPPVYLNTPMQVLLPEGVAATMITDEDRYYNRQIMLFLPGDHRAFYEQNPIVNTYASVSKLNVTYNSNNQTVITVTTNKIQGYKYIVENNALSLTLDQPSKIYDKIVILDAGHGGKDPGAVHGPKDNPTKEKLINFEVLNVYAKECFKDSGIKVYYTRVDDTLIALDDRASYALETEADLFISLHCNAAGNAAARGSSVYYSTINKAKGVTGLTSKILATALVNSLSASLETANRGTIDKGFVVVRDNSVPAVLIELAFLTNPEDKAKLVSPVYQRMAAQSIFDTVVNIFNAYPTNR